MLQSKRRDFSIPATYWQVIDDSLFPVERRKSSFFYSMQWVTFLSTCVIALLGFNWCQKKHLHANSLRITPALIFSKKSMFLTCCNGLNFDNICTYILIFTLWACWNLIPLILKKKKNYDEVFDLMLCVSPWSDLRGWLGVTRQLLAYLFSSHDWWIGVRMFCHPI